MLYVNIFVVICTMFFTVTLVAYVMMFFTFVQARRLAMERDLNTQEEPVFHIISDSRFFISVMLTFSYLLLTIIPTLIRAFYKATNSLMSETMSIFIDVFIRLSGTANGMIYISMNPPVRKILLQQYTLFCCKMGNVHIGAISSMNLIPEDLSRDLQPFANDINNYEATTEFLGPKQRLK